MILPFGHFVAHLGNSGKIYPNCFTIWVRIVVAIWASVLIK